MYFSLSIADRGLSGFGDQGFPSGVTFRKSSFPLPAERPRGYCHCQAKVSFCGSSLNCPSQFSVLKILGLLKINKPRSSRVAVHYVHRKFPSNFLSRCRSSGDSSGVKVVFFGFIFYCRLWSSYFCSLLHS